ncbi:MAG: 16S rRNA (adenine(1518)-N(6)/adenine(1519)-N(6))-dimethyltransferase RsmA [Candidatus Dadabacteria bacterium]|nr:16S rRNA (adenine(1518)-N(6)/adenine(1519)-N(6))-dimethyltransferase RsmA [Candidatus Dadabacteria bacterium]
MALPVSPDKRLGQNFLVHTPTLERICASARLTPPDEVVEIGPGLGHLTRVLLKSGARVSSIEKDPRLADVLPEEITSNRRFSLVRADILDVGFDRFFKSSPLKLVSNLPYSITSPVLKMLAGGRSMFSLAVLMVQKEVALRVCARPGTREVGAVSLSIQMVFDAEKLFDVPPSRFKPRPAVTSSVIRLTPLSAPRIPVLSEEFFSKTVRAAFSVRRKMVRNSLLSAFEKNDVLRALDEAGVSGGARAESLTLEQFARISDRLFESAGGT